MIRMTLDCVRPTQSSVVPVHRKVDLKCFFTICHGLSGLSTYGHHDREMSIPHKLFGILPLYLTICM